MLVGVEELISGVPKHIDFFLHLLITTNDNSSLIITFKSWSYLDLHLQHPRMPVDAHTLRNQILVSVGRSNVISNCSYKLGILGEFLLMITQHTVMFSLQVCDSNFQLLLDFVRLL